MFKLISAGAVFAASAAWGLGLGIGGFGGFALPTGDMAAGYDYELGATRFYEFWPDGGDLGSSPKFGAKFMLGVVPALEFEARFGYAINHHLKSWEDVVSLSEPKTTMATITVGANYKILFGSAGLYVGAGGGYYLESVGFYARWWDIASWAVLTGVATANKPGIYGGGGFTYTFGKLALDVNLRLNYVINDGEYVVHYELQRWGKPIAWSHTSKKPYNDTFVDLLAGVNYYFM